MNPAPTSLWCEYELPEASCRAWRIGPLRLWLRRAEGQLAVASSRETADEHGWLVNQAEEPPAEIAWQFWVLPATCTQIRLRPVMADRPVVVRPERTLRLPAGASAVFHALVPVWVQVELVHGPGLPASVLPTVALSSTWLGENTMVGQLCYAMRTSARVTLTAADYRPHRAVCPIAVHNATDNQLSFDRLCLQGDHLNLYADGPRLWTSRTETTFRSGLAAQIVEQSEQPPADVGPGVMVTPAREQARTGLSGVIGWRFDELLGGR
jgi:hypothetical protein